VKGKYNSERDKILDWMTTADWANESCGSVEVPVGHFARMTNEESDRAGIMDAFGEDMAGCESPVRFEDLLGHFIVRENDQGFVTVEEFDTLQDLLARWNKLYREFDTWNSAESEAV